MTDDAPRRRRWLWVAIFIVLVGASVLPGTYLFIRWQGDRELAAVRAELDAADPNWRMPDLFAARNERLSALRPNSAETVAAVCDRLPDGWEKSPAEGEEPLWPSDGAPNRLPTSAQSAHTRHTHEAVKSALELAHTLRDQPTGGTALVVPDFSAYLLNLSLADTQKRRQVARLLAVDAAVAALDGDPAAGVRAVHAGLNAARSVGDEPTLISQLVRAACDQMAVRSAERVLGLCEPDAGLAELQAALLDEADVPAMWHGMRGELASFDQIMSNMRTGTVGGAASGMPNGYTLSPFFARDHAVGLRLMQRGMTAFQQTPIDTDAVTRYDEELKAKPRYQVMVSSLLAPAFDKCLIAEGNRQAALRVAAVGLACERHRRTTGGWPGALSDLSKELLPVVPDDPFDGQPVRYRRTADGAVVYSVGEDKSDDAGKPQTRTGRRGGQVGDIAFHLFDPDKRRLPALPPAPADEP